ncbi:MAG: hypothetical protein AAGC56_12675 [Pseudomonadota bacterium]
MRVLFVCNLNSVRSPMAAALLRGAGGADFTVDSAGVYEGWLDPFAAAAVAELDLSLDEHEPKAMKAMDLAAFDAVVALTDEAAAEARRVAPDAAVELWTVPNPSNERGDREAVMTAYRGVRDALAAKIADRFGVTAPGAAPGAGPSGARAPD